MKSAMSCYSSVKTIGPMIPIWTEEPIFESLIRNCGCHQNRGCCQNYGCCPNSWRTTREAMPYDSAWLLTLKR